MIVDSHRHRQIIINPNNDFIKLYDITIDEIDDYGHTQ